jgi:hypothetical protein
LFWKFSATSLACGAVNENVTRRSGRTVALLALAFGGAAGLFDAMAEGPKASSPATLEQTSAHVSPIRVHGLNKIASRFVFDQAPIPGAASSPDRMSCPGGGRRVATAGQASS